MKNKLLKDAPRDIRAPTIDQRLEPYWDQRGRGEQSPPMQSHSEQSTHARGVKGGKYDSKQKDPKIGDPREKSDFDDLVNAIKLNIMNSYSQFRNKKDVDFGDWGEGNKKKDPTKLDTSSAKKRPTSTDMGGDPTKEKPLASNRGALGSKESGLMYQRGGKQQRLGGDPRIYGSRQANRQDPANRAVAREQAEKNPPKPDKHNRYQVDEKGKYIRGTGYDKKITGSTTRESKRRGGSETSSQSREAHPQNRTYRRDEQKLQDAQRLGQGSGGGNKKLGTIQEDRIFGAETQEPAAPHRHLREQDKEGKIIRNRYSTDPHNVKPIKGGRKKDPKEAEDAVRQGMRNLKGKTLTRYIMRSMNKVKADLDELMKKIERSPITGENYETEGGEGTTVPARNLGTDERFRGKPAGVIHKKPKNEAEQTENKRGKELARNQWKKDFAMHYIAPDKKEIDRYMKFRKALKALMNASLSPISFTYKYKGWGNTYERGQTKQVETQDHSRTGNTNNKQFYEDKPENTTNKPSKDDLTIKSLDQVYSEWTKKRNER